MSGIRWNKIEKTGPKTVAIVCTGPSLKFFDFNKLRSFDEIIAVNDAGGSIPFGTKWFTLDPWGLHKNQAPSKAKFSGELYAAVPCDYGNPNATCRDHRRMPPPNKFKFLHRVPMHPGCEPSPQDFSQWGLNEDPRCINSGNSGFGALNLAYHMYPKTIVFFGLDATSGYYFKNMHTRSLSHLPHLFNSSKNQLDDRGIKVFNASINSKVNTFEKITLDEAVKIAN